MANITFNKATPGQLEQTKTRLRVILGKDLAEQFEILSIQDWGGQPIGVFLEHKGLCPLPVFVELGAYL